MKTTFDRHAQVRSVWLATALIAAAGFGLLWQPDRQRLNDVRATAHDLYQRANANEEKVRRSGELEVLERRVRSDLSHLRGQTSGGDVSALSLKLFSSLGSRDGVDVFSVAPVALSPQSGETHDVFTGQDLTLGARGRFRNLVAFVADLSKRDILIDVHDVDLVPFGAAHAGGVPLLNATIRATMYRPRSLKAMLFSEVTRATRIAR